MRRTRIGLVFFAFIPLFTASASEISEIPFEKCDWPLVHSLLGVDSARRQSDISAHLTPLATEIKALVNKAKDPQAPIDKQLDKQDLVKLNQIMQRSNSIIAADRLESHRDRDRDVFDNLLQVIDKNYRWFTPIPENSPDHIYQDIINILPAIAPQNENEQVTIPPSQTCILQVALFRIESEATAKLDELSNTENADHILTVMQGMAKRYHVENLDQAKLSQEDKRTFEDIKTRFIIPAEHERQFISYIEAVRILDAASEMIYETGKQDLTDSGGDGTKVGTSLARKIQNHELSERMIRAIGIMRIIGSKIPPRFEMKDY